MDFDMTTHNDERKLRAVLEAEIGTHLAVLRDLGYGAPALALAESRVLPALKATFSAPRRELWMQVAFPNHDPRARPRHVMTAFVYRREGEEERDSLYVDWFAAVHRPDLFDALERHAYGKRALSDFVRAAVPLYATLFREDLHPILAGESWLAGSGDPEVARAFGFLMREHGFSRPDGRTHFHEETLTYTRGVVKVRIERDGGPGSLVTIEAGGRSHTGWRIPFAEAAEFLKAHPEVLSGDFRAIREWEKARRA